MTLPARSHAQRRLALLFAVPFAFSVVFFAVTLFSDQIDLELQSLQNLTSCVARLRFAASDIEIGQHGFLLTGNQQYLVPLEEASASLPAEIRACQRAAAERSPQLQARLTALADLVGQQSKQASEVLDVLHQRGPEAALELVKADSAVESARQVRRASEALEERLADQQTDYLNTQRKWNNWTYLFFLVGTAAMVLVMVRLYQAAVSYLHGRDALQAQLHDLNVALESEVEQRTRDLKAANEELQQFAYVASHDLQEPLRTITSFTQLLESRYRGKLDDDADEFMSYIVTASRRMTDLINGLLTLARLRRVGQPTMPVSFEGVVTEVESNLAVAIRENGAVITKDPLPSLVVDKVQISQLMQNLISNAIKYRRPQEPPRIHISARRDGSNWIFSVQDNGRGFNPQFADRIFGLFQRLPGKSGVDGTGIGLSIARKIIERHGGRIWADSTEGAGATFSFSLPMSLEVSRETAQAMSAEQVIAQGNS